MAHVEKYNAGALGHMLSHYDRTKDNLNDNIDQTKTHLNYNLAAELQPLRQTEFIHQRLAEVRVQKRKDVNVLCDWVVTVPKDLPIEEHQNFFQGTYDFLKYRYGSENVISAYVHMDEKTPHIHFAFMPIIPDKKRGGFKLSAKETITRTDLRTFHDSLSLSLRKILGHPVTVLNGATRDGNKSIQELKRESATAQMNHIQQQKRDAEKRLEAAQEAEQEARHMHDSYEAKKAYIDHLDETETFEMYPSYAQVSTKTLIHQGTYVTVPQRKWEEKCLTIQEKEAIKKAREEFEKSATGQKEKELEHQIETLKSENSRLKSQLTVAEHTQNAAITEYKKYKAVFKKYPQLKERVDCTYKKMRQNVTRTINHDRDYGPDL